MMSHESISDRRPAPAKAHAFIDSAGLTDVGRARPMNEDAYLIATLQRSMVVHDASPEAARGWLAGESAGTLLVVADGLGAEGGGDIASRIAVNTVVGYLLNAMPWAAAPASGEPVAATARDEACLPGLPEQLSSALVVGDSTVKSAAARTATPHMGTTLTMALLLWPVLHVAHVGDTRCYLWRSGKLRRLTTDHTVAQRVFEDAAQPVDPASHLHHVLWNSLGGSESLPKPEIVKLDLQLGDVLLLCSDGLTKHVTDDQLALVLSADGPNAMRCAKLVELANAQGGSDNVTVVLASARQAAPPSVGLPGSVAQTLQM